MALIYLDPAPDPRARQQLAMAMIGQGLGGLVQRQKENQLLHGTPGPGLKKLTAKGAPGLDPQLAGPALAMTQPGGMAAPGLLTGRDPDDEGSFRTLLQQAFANRGGGLFGGQ